MSTNPTIGMVECPLSGELACVRKDKRGHFYYISVAGRIAPSGDFGQEWFLEHATIWGDGDPPDDCPDWIRQGKSFPPHTRSRQAGARRNTEPTATSEAVDADAGVPAADVPPAPAEAAPKRPHNPFSIFGDDDA